MDRFCSRWPMTEPLDWTMVVQAYGGILLLSGSLGLAFWICRFVRRVRAKFREIPPTLESKRILGIWTFMTLPFILLSVPIAAIAWYLTGSIQLSLWASAMVIGPILFLWGVPVIVPVLSEEIRKSLGP